MFSPTSDTFERIRRWAIPPVGGVVHLYNEATNSALYVESHTTRPQFVGRVPKGEEAVERDLQYMGFQRNPLASLKHLIGTKEREEGSFRWLGTHSVPWTNEYDDTYQLHVILYDGAVIPDATTGETYVYAHWEARWDVAPLKHYRGDGLDIERGVQMTQQFFDAYGIEYDDQRPPPQQ